MATLSFLRGSLRLLPLFGSLLLLNSAAQAKNIGGDPPGRCSTCECAICPQQVGTSSTLSRTEGNVNESVPVSRTLSGSDTTIDITAVYNSYNADGSRATVDTVMGYGWTHSYNVFLFTQFGAMFRYDGVGRVTKFGAGPGGTFITSTGYFETLVKNADGSYTLTRKDKTVFRFASVAGTLFNVGGPVWRLTSIVDRNGNTTTLTYLSGNLKTVADTYGRATTFSCNASGKVTTVSDPAGRTTTFTYDSTGHKLTQITDPSGRTIQYSYNTLFQLTDKDGRTFTYTYAASEPSSVKVGAGGSAATMANPANWATDATQLASAVMRVYTPSTTSVTDGRGNLWRYQYDSHGYLTQATTPDGSTSAYTYDPATLMPASYTDGNGHTTSYQYDAQGNLTRRTDAAGNITTYTYEPVFNMMTSTTDPRGRTTTEKNATQFVDVLKETICFCKPCTIWLLGCNVGLGDIPAEIAKTSKCTVRAPKGYVGTMPIPSNPKVARIQKTWGEKYPEHPGATGDFGTFKPPDADKK